MEKFVKARKDICELCLNFVSSENIREIEQTVKEVLNILQLQLNEQEKNKPVICHDCSTKLFSAFQFKATCMDTEDCIFPYHNSESGTPVDLRQIYVKERNKEHLIDVLEDERICRLCMQLVTSDFTSVEEMDDDTLHRCIPEVNFNSTKEPVICNVCVKLLHVHMDFLTNCVNVREKINSVCGSGAIECLSYIGQKDAKVKPEIVEIKLEDVGDESFSVSKNESVNCKSKNNQDSSFTQSGIKKYKCDYCGYRVDHKLSFSLHLLKHKECPNLPTFNCEKCCYTTQRKGNYTRHQQIHKDFSEVPAYKCDKCQYITKIKQNLQRHQLTHKDFSQTPTYKCNICGMETIHKYNFKKHQAIHKDCSQVRMYKCEECDFQTKHKSSFGFHLLRHKNPGGEMYKCDKCDYVTLQKNNLSVHKQKHKELSRYKCDTCGYESNSKSHLIRHMLVHKSPSEGNLYRCEKCGFKTKHRVVIAKHQLTRKCLRNSVVQA